MNDAQRIPLVRDKFRQEAKRLASARKASADRDYLDVYDERNQDLSDEGIRKAISRVRRGTSLANPVDAAARSVIEETR